MFSEVTARLLTDRLLHNLRTLRALIGPQTRLCAALKANAYGHGMSLVAPILQKGGADMAAVAQLDEAIELRRIGWTRPILVFGHVLGGLESAKRRERIDTALGHQLILTVTEDGDLLRDIDAAARSAGRPLSVHLKIDTGMGRMGFTPDEGLDALREAATMRGLRICGVYSHLATADEANDEHVRRQLSRFDAFLASAAPLLPEGALRHVANTAAALRFPEARLDLVRIGLGLYGYHPSEVTRPLADLRPALRVTSRVTEMKWLPTGHCIGYGCTVWTQRRTRIGIVPVGYGDGYWRALSNHAIVGMSQGDAPVVGRISMDQMAIDLTDLPDAAAGDSVVLLDETRSRPNSVESTAKLLSAIPYEVTCSLGSRIARSADAAVSARVEPQIALAAGVI